jgi:aconitate hydratase 2/2-methylisocitrate dehydratase
MTNIGHFRAAGKILEGKSDIPTRLWIAPPTKMDALILTEEGYYGVLGKSGARMEMPGCALCMGRHVRPGWPDHHGSGIHGADQAGERQGR